MKVDPYDQRRLHETIAALKENERQLQAEIKKAWESRDTVMLTYRQVASERDAARAECETLRARVKELEERYRDMLGERLARDDRDRY